jgi:hypothetical protein
MTIETIRRRTDDRSDFLITCDEKGCGSALDAKDRTFQQAAAFWKARHWRCYKSFGSWSTFVMAAERRPVNCFPLSSALTWRITRKMTSDIGTRMMATARKPLATEACH